MTIQIIFQTERSQSNGISSSDSSKKSSGFSPINLPPLSLPSASASPLKTRVSGLDAAETPQKKDRSVSEWNEDLLLGCLSPASPPSSSKTHRVFHSQISSPVKANGIPASNSAEHSLFFDQDKPLTLNQENSSIWDGSSMFSGPSPLKTPNSSLTAAAPQIDQLVRHWPQDPFLNEKAPVAQAYSPSRVVHRRLIISTSETPAPNPRKRKLQFGKPQTAQTNHASSSVPSSSERREAPSTQLNLRRVPRRNYARLAQGESNSDSE